MRFRAELPLQQSFDRYFLRKARRVPADADEVAEGIALDGFPDGGGDAAGGGEIVEDDDAAGLHERDVKFGVGAGDGELVAAVDEDEVGAGEIGGQ